MTEDEIVAELEALIGYYARDREGGERFGDFVIRAGYVQAMGHRHDEVSRRPAEGVG